VCACVSVHPKTKPPHKQATLDIKAVERCMCKAMCVNSTVNHCTSAASKKKTTRCLLRAAGAVWTMAVDTGQTVLAVGSVSNEVQIYTIRKGSEAEQRAASAAAQGRADKAAASEESLEEVVSLHGILDHDTVQRVAHICFSHDGGFLAACSTGVICVLRGNRAA
jgi:hypothetical protein